MTSDPDWYRHFKIICKTMDKCNCALSEDQRDILAGVLASLYAPKVEFTMTGVRVVKKDESHG